MSGDNPTLDDYFNGCLYFSISRLQRHVNKLAEGAFAETGLAPSHAFLLMALNEHETCSAGELADMMGLAPSTITRFVDKLEKQGLCSRRLEGRVSYAAITPQGQALIPAIQAGWKDLFQNYNQAYGEENARQLNDTIVSFNKSLAGK